MTRKTPVCPDRIRTNPEQFSRVDQHLARDRYIERLTHKAQALYPAAKLWLDTVANVRIHGETRKKPVEMLLSERLLPLLQYSYDVATVSSVRASSQFRVTLDSNRYSWEFWGPHI